jgi:hypothetical protein
MRRVLVVLGLVAAAGVGAYGQAARGAVVQNFEIFNYNSVYLASMCADKTYVGSGGTAAAFMMRPVRPLANNWFEAEVASTVDSLSNHVSGQFDTIRINLAQLCYVKPMQP